MCDQYSVYEYKRVNDCSIKCDVYPGVTGAPVAVYIHGGGLIFGGRGDLPAATVEPFMKEGYWVVSIDYRLAPETKLPQIVEDVRDALDWVRMNRRKEFDYDADRMVVIGGSAGGYLTLMAGTFDKKPRALVSLYGYGNILGDWYRNPSPHYCKEPLVSLMDAQKAIKNIELSEVNTAERFPIYLRSRQNGTWVGMVSGYDMLTEMEKIESYCPILNIAKDYPPTMLLHGDKDTDVPYEQSVDMYNALRAHGLTAELITYPGGDHAFDWNKNDPIVSDMANKALTFVKAHI